MLWEIGKYLIYIGNIAAAVISISSFLCKYVLPVYSKIQWLDKTIKYMHIIALNPSRIKSRMDI